MTFVWIAIVFVAFIIGIVVGSITTISALQSSGYAVFRTKDKKYVIFDMRDKMDIAESEADQHEEI